CERWLTDPRFATPDLRRTHSQEMHDALQDVLLQMDAEQLETRLSAAGVPCGMVRDVTEAISLPRLAERRLTSRLHIEWLPGREQVEIVNAGFLFGDDTPAVQEPPPRLGEHNEEILESLGFDAEQRRQLSGK